MKLWRASLLMILLGGFVSSAHALRCGSRLVLDGDQDFQVRDRCDQPYWIDRYTGLDVQGAGGTFARVLTLIDGRVGSVENMHR